MQFKKWLKLKKPSKLEWIILAVIGSVIGIAGIWQATTLFIDSQKTYPLGKDFEYLGKEGSRCSFGFTPEGFKFGYCPRTYIYFYSTDMNLEQLKTYFKNTTHEEGSYIKDTPATTGPSWSVTSKASGEGVGLTTRQGIYTSSLSFVYYDDVSGIARYFNPFNSSKKHGIMIGASDYETIRQLLP